MPDPVMKALMECLDHNTPCVLATIVQAEGSVPRAIGAKMLVLQGGESRGTIGGGALEAAVLQACEEALRTGEPRLLSYDLRPDLGMMCGGRARVFIEPQGVVSRLYLFGAGHVCKAVHGLAAGLGFLVTVIDDRPRLASEERFPGCASLVHSYDKDRWDGLEFDQDTYCVVATAGHAIDTRVVTQLLAHQPRYVGMIGSLTKRRAVERKLLNQGIPRERLASLHTPMGLPIGAESPEEIAVSIAAELIQVRTGTTPVTKEKNG